MKDCIYRSVVISVAGILLASVVTGCASFTARAVAGGAHSLTLGIQTQEDVQLVGEGLPAYVLALDGMVVGSPNDAELLMGAARLNGLYASYFVADAARGKKYAEKSLGYARRAWCTLDRNACGIDEKSYQEFDRWLKAQLGTRVDALYLLANALATWIRVNSADLGEVAKLVYVEAIFLRVIELDEKYDHGNALAALGVLNALVPAAMGGHPERAQRYFERSLKIAGESNQMPKVMYARHYARLVFDRALHDGLLRDVVVSTSPVENLKLSNALARKEARMLLDTADEYF